jgi:2-methylcitrate dehydratase PrpD
MLTQRLAQFVTDTRIEDIPNEVLDGARAAIIDTLGCAIAGSIEETAEIAAARAGAGLGPCAAQLACRSRVCKRCREPRARLRR